MTGLKMKYFVLSPISKDDEHALASREAILAYAKSIQWSNPKLAADLCDWMEQLDINDDREGK